MTKRTAPGRPSPDDRTHRAHRQPPRGSGWSAAVPADP